MYELQLSKSQEMRAKELCSEISMINLLDPANVMFEEDYIREIRMAQIAAENITAASPYADDLKETLCILAEWCRLIEKYSNSLTLVDSTDDIAKAKEDGKVGLIFGLQGLNILRGFSKHSYSPKRDLGLLEILHRVGVRIMQLTYQSRNLLANGCAEKDDEGLSMLGVRAIEEMNRLGVVIDLSHLGKKSTMEALETSKHPVIFSHSNVAALVDHVRNIDDGAIKALAKNGGVMGICPFGPFVRVDAQPTLDDYLRHIDHVVELVGVDHVGIGLDVYPPTPKEWRAEYARLFPEIEGEYKFSTEISGLKKPGDWPNIVRGLVARGYTDGDIHKILGKNALRVFKKVWK